ncbi:bacillithiol system redox-active protein YtxJ [Paenibacillus solisilvae]|uniref:Bacillithiol system redox-active protein YtxJ n=1 Tax=Paenibacillus solisilvae TaxID=2486751 RepID=A0ABW0W1V2_9BACL
MEQIASLTSIPQWEEALAASHNQPLFLFKHSTNCPTSSGAYEELTNWIEDARGLFVNIMIVYVIENRSVSNAISEQLGIKHESPQVILLSNGRVLWHESHWSITYSTLDQHLGTHCEK